MIRFFHTFSFDPGALFLAHSFLHLPRPLALLCAGCSGCCLSLAQPCRRRRFCCRYHSWSYAAIAICSVCCNAQGVSFGVSGQQSLWDKVSLRSSLAIRRSLSFDPKTLLHFVLMSSVDSQSGSIGSLACVSASTSHVTCNCASLTHLQVLVVANCRAHATKSRRRHRRRHHTCCIILRHRCLINPDFQALNL